MKILSNRSAALASCLFMLSACSSTELPALAETDVPSTWASDAGAAIDAWPDTQWWAGFNNEELSEYIKQVQSNNIDLQINQRNLESAQLVLREAGFELLPTPVIELGTSPSYRDSRIDGETVRSTTNDAISLSASASYNNILSKPASFSRAQSDYDSSVAQAADVALNTLSTSASSYFQLLLTRDKITTTTQNVENALAIYEIAQARVEAGVAIPIEALQQQIALEAERINLQSFQQNDLAIRSSLALLSGQSVQDFDLQGQSLDEVEVPSVQPGLPSELLNRRPNLVEAEANMRSASANVDLVKTALFPQISLTAGTSAASNSLSDLVANPENLLFINASLVQLLLDNGQRGRDIEQARLSLENSLSRYRSEVISAFNEIDVLLSNMQLLAAQTELAQQNLDSAEESFRIAQARYEEGVTDFLTVLTSQNTLFSTRNTYLDRKQAQLNTSVALFQALGGGWEREER